MNIFSEKEGEAPFEGLKEDQPMRLSEPEEALLKGVNTIFLNLVNDISAHMNDEKKTLEALMEDQKVLNNFLGLETGLKNKKVLMLFKILLGDLEDNEKKFRQALEQLFKAKRKINQLKDDFEALQNK